MLLAMADDQTNSSFQERAGEGGRTPRPGGGREGAREPGGFRIRLSDNEMRAARALQEAFRLRSTVAVLGFALRTTAQLLEDGKLDELVEQQRSQAPARGEGRRGDGPRGDGPRGGRREGRPDGRFEARSERGPRLDPFARPARPAAPQTAQDADLGSVDAAADVAPEAADQQQQDLDAPAAAPQESSAAAAVAEGDAPESDAPSGDA